MNNNIQHQIPENTFWRMLVCYACIFFIMMLIGSIMMACRYFSFPQGIFGDFHWRWQECAYVLQGINPIDVIKGLSPVDETIGRLNVQAGTVPWAYSIGNVINPGFIPYEISRIYGFFLFPITAVITGMYAYRYLVREYGKSIFPVICILLYAFFPHWFGSFLIGNAGLISSCCIICMIIAKDKSPYLAGILLALASIKPQLAGLFYISLLLQKEWKVFITASGLVLVSWLVSSLLTSTPPLTMFLEMGEQGANYMPEGKIIGMSYYGIFTILIDYGILTTRQCILASAGFGLFVAVVASLFVIKNKSLKNNTLLYYSIPAIVSAFWAYKNGADLVVLAIPMFAFIMALSKLSVRSVYVKAMIIIVVSFYLSHVNYLRLAFSYVLQKMFEITGMKIFHYSEIFSNYFLVITFWISWLMILFYLHLKKPAQNLSIKEILV